MNDLDQVPRTTTPTLMAETQINEPPPANDSRSMAPEGHSPQASSIVCDSWQQMVQAVMGVVLLLGAFAMVHYYAPTSPQGEPPSDLEQQVHALTAQVEQLRQDQAMPAVVLNRYRNSIGYIYGVYQVGFANQRPVVRARVSGTGFLIGNGLLATNRHVAEPWYGDAEAQKLIDQGATGMLESLVVFFPGSPTPVALSPASVSKTSDLAVLRAEDSNLVRGLARTAIGEVARSSGTTRHRNRLSHGHCRDGGEVSYRNLRTPGLSTQ